jgi:hypothetical protein
MPQKETLDKAAYTCLLVSYGRLLAQFQFSLSADTLGYLSQWRDLLASPANTLQSETRRSTFRPSTADEVLNLMLHTAVSIVGTFLLLLHIVQLIAIIS